jgi:hypothetical protein
MPANLITLAHFTFSEHRDAPHTKVAFRLSYGTKVAHSGLVS